MSAAGVIELPVADTAIALSQFESISGPHEDRAGNSHYVAHLLGEGTQRLSEYSHRALMHRPVQLIPSEPGTSVVEVYDRILYRERVIAWALCFDGRVRPVTAYGVQNNDRKDVFVEMPGGQIESVGEASDVGRFDDAAEMVRHFIARAPKAEKPSKPHQ